jgi:PKD repeat protein
MKTKLILFAFMVFTFHNCKKEEVPPAVKEVKASFSLPTQNLYVTCPIKLTNTSTNGTAFSWDFGDGETSTSKDAEHIYKTAGTFTIKLKVSEGSASNETTQSIKIEPLPPITSTFTVPNVATHFINVPIVFTNTSIGATKSEWNFGDGGTSVELSPSHAYTNIGTYEVTLKTTGPKGSAESKQTLKLNVGVNADFSIPSGTLHNGCEITFQNTTVGALNIEWNFGDGGTSTVFSPNHIYKDLGTYTVTMKASNTFENKVVTKNVIVTSPSLNKVFSQNNLSQKAVAIFPIENNGYAVFYKEIDYIKNTEGFVYEKFNESGASLLQKKYFGLGKEWLESVVEVEDGYVLGYTTHEGTVSKFAAMKIDINGIEIWSKSYFVFSPKVLLTNIIKSHDNGFLLIGEQGNQEQTVQGALLIHIENNGTQKRIITQASPSGVGKIYKCISTSDNHYLCVGEILENNTRSGWFLKYDSSFNVVNNRTHSGNIKFTDVVENLDNSFILVGTKFTSTDNDDAVVFKLQKSGSGLATLASYSTSSYDWFRSIIKTEDGYLAMGATYNNSAYYRGLLMPLDKSGFRKTEYLIEKPFNTEVSTGNKGKDCSLIFSGFSDKAHFSDAELMILKTDYQGKLN